MEVSRLEGVEFYCAYSGPVYRRSDMLQHRREGPGPDDMSDLLAAVATETMTGAANQDFQREAIPRATC